MPDAIPRSLIVVGSGAIGVEFASFYRDFGAEGDAGEVLPRMSRQRIQRSPRWRIRGCEERSIGSRPHEGYQVEEDANGITAAAEDANGKPQTLKAERLISAVGVVGDIENLGLEALGVKTERGIILTDGSAAPM